MFDSVLDGNARWTRSLRAGAVSSVALHAALVCAAMWISGRTVIKAKLADEGVPTIFVARQAQRGIPDTPSSSSGPVRPRPHAVPPRPLAAVLKPVERASPVEALNDAPTENDSERSAAGRGVRGGAIVGDPNSTCIGQGCSQDGPPGPSVSRTTAVMDFAGDMRPPRLLEGEEIAFTREALEAHARGTMLVQCTITIEGRVTDCRILKPVPHMERAVLRALATRRYTPVLFEGKPMPVRYTFVIQLVGPQ